MHIRQSKTAKEGWEVLQTAFEDKGVNNRCKLLRKLVSTRLEPFNSIQAYVTEIMSISQKLRDIGKEVHDRMLTTLMLQGLTKQYAPVRIAIENSNINITTDYVKTKLLPLDVEIESSASKTAILTRDRKSKNLLQTRNGQPRRKKWAFTSQKQTVKCFICSRPHQETESPKYPNLKNLSNPEKSSGSVALLAAFQERKQKSTVITAFSLGIQESEWYIKSGATSHMTKKRDWLKNYKEESNKKVMCANSNRL